VVVKWLNPVVVLVAGGCLSASGLFYGIFTVGVPTPDATPAVAAQERRDTDRAGVAVLAGLGVSAVGGAGLAVLAVMRLAGWREPDAEQSAAAERGGT